MPIPVPSAAPSIEIAILNQSSVVSDTDVQTAIIAIQSQIDNEFYNSWHIRANLVFNPATIQTTDWPLYIQDNTDMLGAGGYHYETLLATPFARVFAVTDQSMGINWTVALSHEILEMLVDPSGTMRVLNSSNIYILEEVCDPVQANTYQIGNVAVSDFVFPAWFSVSGTSPYDQLGLITSSFQVMPGGYSK